MTKSPGTVPTGEMLMMAKPDLGRLIDRLWQEGYIVVGPTVSEGAIVFDELRGADALPIGWTGCGDDVPGTPGNPTDELAGEEARPITPGDFD